MRTHMDHLTAPKRQKLVDLVSVLFDKLERAREGKNAAFAKSCRILKIVLFWLLCARQLSRRSPRWLLF